jgi:hypothetical protein
MVDGTAGTPRDGSLDLYAAAEKFVEQFPVDFWEDGSEDASEPQKPVKKTAPEEADSEAAADEGDAPAEEPTETVEDTEEESEESADAEAPAVFLIRVDGEDVEVTQDELAKGYSRQADYTKKTMALSEERKALLSETESVRVERAKFAEGLKQLEQAINQQTPPEPNWDELRQTLAPGEFADHWAQWDRHRSQMAQLRQERMAAEAKVTEDSAKTHAELLQAEGVKLLEAIPEWKNPEVAKARKAAVTQYAVEALGANPQELAALANHKIVVLLDKAEKYDALQKAKPAVQKTIQSVRLATPAAPAAKKPASDLTRAKQRHAKIGTVESLAEAFKLMD